MEKSAKERLCETLDKIDILLDIKYGPGRYGHITPEAIEDYTMLSRMALSTYAHNVRSNKNDMGIS